MEENGLEYWKNYINPDVHRLYEQIIRGRAKNIIKNPYKTPPTKGNSSQQPKKVHTENEYNQLNFKTATFLSSNISNKVALKTFRN